MSLCVYVHLVLCVCVFGCGYVYVCVGVCSGQKKASNLQELELHAGVSCPMWVGFSLLTLGLLQEQLSSLLQLILMSHVMWKETI